MSVSRRDFLRFRVARPEPPRAPPPAPAGLAPTERPLPRVIAWLDPSAAPPPPPRARGPLPLLRPPGAIEETEFLTRCTRCNDCAAACPHQVLFPLGASKGMAAGTPSFDPVRAPCLLCEDLPCISACTTGALVREGAAPMASVTIQHWDCLNALGAECRTCIERCPVEGVLTFAAGRIRVNDATCTGCGACQHACPAPNNAVVLLPNPARPRAGDPQP